MATDSAHTFAMKIDIMLSATSIQNENIKGIFIGISGGLVKRFWDWKKR